MIVPQGSGANQIYTYCFALDSFSGGVAGSGRMVSDDSSGTVSSGALYAQGGSNFTLNSAKGSWVFGMQGGMYSNNQVGRAADAGYVTLDGAGNITAGEADFSVDMYDSGGNISNNFFQWTGFNGSYTLRPVHRAKA